MRKTQTTGDPEAEKAGACDLQTRPHAKMRVGPEFRCSRLGGGFHGNPRTGTPMGVART